MRHTKGVGRRIVEWFDRLAQKREREEEKRRDYMEAILDAYDSLLAIFNDANANAASAAPRSPMHAFTLAAIGIAAAPGVRHALGF